MSQALASKSNSLASKTRSFSQNFDFPHANGARLYTQKVIQKTNQQKFESQSWYSFETIFANNENPRPQFRIYTFFSRRVVKHVIRTTTLRETQNLKVNIINSHPTPTESVSCGRLRSQIWKVKKKKISSRNRCDKRLIIAVAREVTGKSCRRQSLGVSGGRQIFAELSGLVDRPALHSRWDTLRLLFLASQTFSRWKNFKVRTTRSRSANVRRRTRRKRSETAIPNDFWLYRTIADAFW